MKWLCKRLGADSLTLITRFLARVHCGLMAAALSAVIYEFLNTLEEIEFSGSIRGAYLRGLLFAVPMALSYYAAQRLPRVWQFFLTSAVLAALCWLLMGHPVGSVALVIFCVIRAQMRVAESTEQFFMDQPSMWGFGLFALLFFLSAAVGWPVSQRLVVISAVLYLLVFLAYRGVDRIEEYLMLNRAMYDLPVRRIRRTAGAAVAALVLVTGLLLLPAAWNVRGDLRVDLTSSQSAAAALEREKEAELMMTQQTSGQSPFLNMEGSSDFRLPPFVNYLLYAGCVAVVGAAILYAVYQLFKNFRFSYTDSRDEVRFLPSREQDEAVSVPKRERKRLSALDRSPNARIRRHYRKTVLRSGGEAPKAWQTPEEIEAWTGVEAPLLHSLYEKARYAKELCTAEDVRKLREKT